MPLRNLYQTQRGSPSCSSSLARFSTPGAKKKMDALLVAADEEILLLFTRSRHGQGAAACMAGGRLVQNGCLGAHQVEFSFSLWTLCMRAGSRYARCTRFTSDMHSNVTSGRAWLPLYLPEMLLKIYFSVVCQNHKIAPLSKNAPHSKTEEPCSKTEEPCRDSKTTPKGYIYMLLEQNQLVLGHGSYVLSLSWSQVSGLSTRAPQVVHKNKKRRG